MVPPNGGGPGSGVRDGLRHARLLAAVFALALAGPASLAEDGPTRIAILATGADAPSARAYADLLRSVSYPIFEVAPDGLGSLGRSILVVPLAEAARLDTELCQRIVAFVEGGGRLLTAGQSPLSRALGIRFAERQVEIGTITEARAPALTIRWGTTSAFTPFTLPSRGKTFAWSTQGRHALVSSFRLGRGTVLFLGVEIADGGDSGSLRFPYLLQAVGEAFGISPPIAARRMTAYADLGDHRGEAPLSIARAWYRRGIREVHVGAWEAFGAEDGTFAELIAACHRYGILVYAWLEPPEISTAFWDEHPSWRERTATGADAKVDWRRLMALNDPACWAAVADGLRAMVQGYDWDGVDLAEVYYESPSGLEAPQLFTPMNRLVREEFAHQVGFDPQELFVESSKRFWSRDPRALQSFLEYRRAKIVGFHERLMTLLSSARERKPHLDLVLTLVDALYDATMRDRIAIDTGPIVALAVKNSFALQVEDPYTLWAMGPERYARIASDYRRLLGSSERLSIDINVVPRGEDVVPTSQQTGLELYRLVSAALRSFPKVCLYSEGTIYPQDFGLLPSALASAATVEPRDGGGVVVESRDGVDLVAGPQLRAVRMDGAEWPALCPGRVLVPRGRHLVEWGGGAPDNGTLRLRDINAILLGASEGSDSLTVRYVSPARAFLTVSFRPSRAELDGLPATPAVEANEFGYVIAAPPGEHAIRLVRR